MTEILQFIGSIPNVIWSGVIASILTLSGVLISNSSNTARLKMQLKHDGEEKARERISIMRRDVYLKTAEELVKLNAHLSSLPQYDLTKGDLGEGFIGFQSASARLQLVAEPQTTLLAMRLSATYGALFLELLQYLMPLSKAKVDIKIADNLYEKSQSEVQRTLVAMTSLNETGKPDAQAFEALQRSFSFHQEQAENFSANLNTAWQQFNTANLIFVRHLFSRIRAIAPEHMKLMVAIRRDLALLGDLSEVEAEMHVQLHDLEQKLNDFLSAIESQISNHPS